MEPSNFKMEDFMDVVYKCKFCPYSCTQSPDMGTHVKEKHLKPTNYDPLPEKNTVVSSLPTGDFMYNVGGTTQLSIEGNVLCHASKNNITIQDSEDVLTFTEAEGQAYMDKSLPRAIPVSESTSLTLGSQQATAPDLTDLISVVKDTTKSVGLGPGSSMMENPHQVHHHTLALQPIGHLPPTQQQEAPLVVPAYSSSASSSSSSLSSSLSTSSLVPSSTLNNHMMPATQSMSVMAIQLPAINSDGNPSQQYIVQASDGSVPLAVNETTDTKEYLLCGLCKLAFTTMEDCQSHMQTEHRELMQGLGVSVGVQVGGGKRGRKRKSELLQTDNQVKVKDEPPDFDPDDLEWLPSVPEGNQTTHRDGRTRRKVIPPKALKEDYVLGRRVVKRRKRRNKDSLGYNVVCPMMNCKARFKTKESMEIHISSHNLDDAAFTCPECKASHDFWKHLRIHLWKVHKIDVDLLTCDMCDYKTDTSHKMSIHKEIHADVKPYKCTICNKGFRQAAQQKNHMTIHRNASTKQESGLWFASKRCEICERNFANSKCLAKHKEAVHAKLKPFQCSFCGHTTARKAMMELHVRTHTGDKPFKCNVCAYTTGDHNSMRRHKMRHTGEKQYQCSMCPYTCIQSISLKQHIKNKHPGVSTGIFQCSRCPFRSINQNHFDSHMLDHKKGLIPDVPMALKVNEAKPKKLSQKQVAGNTKQKGASFQKGMESLFRKHPQFHTVLPNDSATGQPSLETITVGPTAGDLQADVFNMQVTMLAGGDTQVSAEDMARLSENPNLVALGIAPLQLIYATLSTISDQTDLSCVEEGRSSLLTIELVGGIQTSVLSSVQENAITHSITYHIPVMASTSTSVPSLSVPLPLTSVASSSTNSFMGDKMTVAVESGGIGDVGVGGVPLDKINSVINVVDGIELLDTNSINNSNNNNNNNNNTDSRQNMASISSFSSSVPQPSQLSSALNISDGKVDTVKNYQKVSLLDNGSGEGNLVSSSFLTSTLSPGFINLVGSGLKTVQQQQDLTLEVVGQEEERSVFLIEDDGDLVVEQSGNNGNGTVLSHQNNIVIDENGQQHCLEDTNGSSFIVLGGKHVDFEPVDVVGGCSDMGMTTYLKLPERKTISTVGGATAASSTIAGNNPNFVGGYTTLMNAVQVTDQHQQNHMTMINSRGATATTATAPNGTTSEGGNNFVHLIPISFLDQNSSRQEMSSTNSAVHHQPFIPPSSSCG